MEQMNEIDILKQNVYELQEQLQLAYRRIAELREALDVERQSNEQTNSSNPSLLVD